MVAIAVTNSAFRLSLMVRPHDLVEDTPTDDGGHFANWKKPGDTHYLVCHHGLSLKITRRVQKGATACLFGHGKKDPSVYCK